MLARVVQLAEEIAKWEAEEKERARLDGLKAKRAEGLGPSQRPLMIRTGKAKTDGGWRAGQGRAGQCCGGNVGIVMLQSH